MFGISGPAWLYDSRWAMLAVVMMSLLGGIRDKYDDLLIRFEGVSPVPLYEAARVEGANRWQILRISHGRPSPQDHVSGDDDADYLQLSGV